MKTATLGNPAILQKPYTRFYIHYMDIARMEEVLEKNNIPFFAMEMRVSQMNWIIHIPDEYRKIFDDLVVSHHFNPAPMNHSFWFQDRQGDAFMMGIKTKPAKIAIVVIVLVLFLVAILGWIL